MSAYAELRAAAQTVVYDLTCTTPAYGAPGYAHCAACCGGTLIAATCQEEHDLAIAAAQLLDAIGAIDALTLSEVPA